jgi:type IX secretion system PorP/SprF family membrane protein
MVVANVGFAQLGVPLTQFSSNPMIFNPACAGLEDAFSVNLSARKQWMGLPTSPSLVNFDGHAPFENNRHSWGTILQHETWGPMTGSFVYGNYTYKLYFDESSLSFGVQAGVFHSTLNWNKIEHIKNPEDPLFQKGLEQHTKFDVNVGAYYWRNLFYVGVSVKHLAPPKFDSEKRIPKLDDWYPNMGTQFFLMSGVAMLLNDDWSVRPELFLRYVHNTPLSVNVGVQGSFRHRYFVGVNVETGQKAVSLSIKGFITEEIRLGYSYDIFFGAIRRAQNGSHEISINYILKDLWENRRKSNRSNLIRSKKPRSRL